MSLPVGLDPARALEVFGARETVAVKREKNGKVSTFPLATWFLDAESAGAGAFRMTLGLGGDGASVRPDEVLGTIYGPAARSARLVREDLVVGSPEPRIESSPPAAGTSCVERAAD